MAQHLHCHNELLACGEPVPETKKVNDFLAGIQDDRLESAKDTVLGDVNKLSDFDATQQYLSLVVTNKKVSSSSKKRGRQISEAGSTRKTKKTKTSHGLPINGTRTYSNNEWHNVLSEEERKEIQKLRDERKAKRKETKKRKAAAARRQQQEEEDESEDEPEPAKDAGNQFGRGSHKKQKKD